jgi:RHS repeat-associated protein
MENGNAALKLENPYGFYPFGMRLAYQYTGQEYDSELDLHNFRARFYDSDLMRFYAVDPMEEFASSYLFCGNNPIMFIDPSGNERIGAQGEPEGELDTIEEAKRKEEEMKKQKEEEERQKSKGEKFRELKALFKESWNILVAKITPPPYTVTNSNSSNEGKQVPEKVEKDKEDSALKTTVETTTEVGVDVAATVSESKGFLNLSSTLGAISTFFSTLGQCMTIDTGVRNIGPSTATSNGPLRPMAAEDDSLTIYMNQGEYYKAIDFIRRTKEDKK